jgi:hypothetical protein
MRIKGESDIKGATDTGLVNGPGEVCCHEPGAEPMRKATQIPEFGPDARKNS